MIRQRFLARWVIVYSVVKATIKKRVMVQIARRINVLLGMRMQRLLKKLSKKTVKLRLKSH